MRVGALAGAALAGVPAWVASVATAQPAQDTGPVVVRQEGGLKALDIQQLDAAVNLEGRYRRDDRSNPDVLQEERRLRADLELAGRAFIGHENLLDVRGVVRLGIEDLDVDSDAQGASRNDVSTFSLFDISGLFLARSIAPVELYARRDQTLLNREFGATIDTTTTEYGLRSTIGWEAAPTVVRLFHREISQDDPDGIDFDTTQDTLSIQTTPDLGPDHRLELSYIFDSVQESRSGFVVDDYDRHNVAGTHVWSLGPNSLRSTGFFEDRSGRSALTRFRLDELLTLRHTERFETRYGFIFNNEDREFTTQQFMRGYAGLTNRLYDSLRTDAEVGISRETTSDDFSSDDFTSDSVDGSVVADYTKDAPYGRIDASLGISAEQRENSERGDPAPVFDRPLTLNGAPSVINQANVVASTIRVTNLAGTRTYIEGLDYEVRVLPDRIEIRRIIGGAISSGETVLLDYVIGPQPAATFTSISRSTSFRYTLNEGYLAGLGGYVYYRALDRNVDSDSPESFFVDDVTNLRYGLEYRYAPFYIRGEREHQDSEFNPFDTNRVEARYNQRLSYSSSISASLNYELTDFPNDDNQLQIIRAILRWYGQVLPNLGLNLRLDFRDEQSRLFGDSTGFEQSAELTWRLRQTSISAQFRNAYLEAGDSESNSQTLAIQFRREF